MLCHLALTIWRLHLHTERATNQQSAAGQAGEPSDQYVPKIDKGMDSQVVVRRDRLCVAIKAGRQGDLPKGSMSLATSSTGTVVSQPQHGRAIRDMDSLY